jgi:hypothetical protein
MKLIQGGEREPLWVLRSPRRSSYSRKTRCRTTWCSRCPSRFWHPEIHILKYTNTHMHTHMPGNTKGGIITVLLTSCLTGLESAVWQLTFFVFICKTDQSKPVKQEVNGTVILPPFVFPAYARTHAHTHAKARTRTHAHTRTHVRTHPYLHTYTRVCMCVCVYGVFVYVQTVIRKVISKSFSLLYDLKKHSNKPFS